MISELVPLLVPIFSTAIVFSIPIIWIVLNYRKRRRLIELYHAERMAAIERGMDLPPLPQRQESGPGFLGPEQVEDARPRGQRRHFQRLVDPALQLMLLEELLKGPRARSDNRRRNLPARRSSAPRRQAVR